MKYLLIILLFISAGAEAQGNTDLLRRLPNNPNMATMALVTPTDYSELNAAFPLDKCERRNGDTTIVIKQIAPSFIPMIAIHYMDGREVNYKKEFATYQKETYINKKLVSSEPIDRQEVQSRYWHSWQIGEGERTCRYCGKIETEYKTYN